MLVTPATTGDEPKKKAVMRISAALSIKVANAPTIPRRSKSPAAQQAGPGTALPKSQGENGQNLQ